MNSRISLISARPNFLGAALAVALLASAASSPVPAQEAGSSAMATAAISEDKPTTIKLSPGTTTTVILPFDLDDVHGLGFSTDPHKRLEDYVLAFSSTVKNRISLGIFPGGKATKRNLNLMVGGQVFVLMVEPTEGEVPAVVRLTKATASTAANGDQSSSSAGFTSGELRAAVAKAPSGK